MQEHRESENNYWGRFSSTYDRKIDSMIGKGVRQNLFRLLEREHGLVNAVEFGCGTGYFTRAIAENAEHVTATDLSSDMIEASKMNLKDIRNVSFQVEDSEATSFPSETFDTALMANMLHTVDDPLKALEECYRVLKAGGTLLIINYTDQGMGRVERTLMGFRFALKFHFPPKKNWPVTEEKLRFSLEKAGFVIERLDLIKDRINTLYVRAKKS
ncbi:MAG TPA: class I SAM-dependent methyltransferase [Methanocellaceae archaeon]